MSIVRRDHCLLCLRALESFEDGTIQIHPHAEDCNVVFTDAWGVAIDLDVDAWIAKREDQARGDLSESGVIKLNQYVYVDDALLAVFEQDFGVPRLGGMSSGKGWSGFSLFQRCPLAWKKRYLDAKTPARDELVFINEIPALAIGSLIHAFLGLHYLGLRPESPYAKITPKMLFDKLLVICNPIFVHEAWRVFVAYTLHYKFDNIIPLACEHDLKDPRTGESCRFDMIAFIEESVQGRPPGTYIFEFKSHAQFSADNLECYAGDGEILGQIALWKKLGLDLRFGELQGVVVDILGKQPKNPRFHRTWVPPNAFLINEHLEDLRRWDGLIQLAKSSNNFPRARANCVNRWGRCQHFDDCARRDPTTALLESLNRQG